MRQKPFLFFLALSVLFISCEEKNEVENNLWVEHDGYDIRAGAYREMFTITVGSDIKWIATVDTDAADWCRVDFDEEEIGDLILVEVDQNNSGKERTAIITVQADEKKKEVKIVQRYLTSVQFEIDVYPVGDYNEVSFMMWNCIITVDWGDGTVKEYKGTSKNSPKFGFEFYLLDI